MKEFFAIMDVHMIRIGHKKRYLDGGTFHSANDVNELEEDLKAKGII